MHYAKLINEFARNIGVVLFTLFFLPVIGKAGILNPRRQMAEINLQPPLVAACQI